MGELSAAFSYSPINQVTGIPITFTSTSSSVEEIAEIRWSFDDDSDPEYGEEVTHSFSSPGVYGVELNVKDIEDDEDEISQNIIIHDRFGVSVKPNGKVRVRVSVQEYSAGPKKTGRKATEPFDPGPANYDELTTRLASEMMKEDDNHNSLVTAIKNQLQGKVSPE